ncbi:MAG: CZB domain-containing protein, partial [Gallionella sp.]
MKWLNMINRHVAWKQRLLAYLDGTSQEKLDPVNIKKDDVCELGKWIYGEGKANIHIPYYHWVKSNHTLFHEYAAQIVE